MTFKNIVACPHPKAVTKYYVGSTDTYHYCPDCFEAWGGEETVAKKSLIAGAASANVSEMNEVNGDI